MPTDLHELLESAAANPPAFDADAVVDRGLRQRRVRTWSRAGAAVLVVALIAGAIILSLPQPRIVDFVSPSAAPDWPLALRYEEAHSDAGGSGTSTGEFAANGWGDWVHVTPHTDGLGTNPENNGLVERWSDGSSWLAETRIDVDGDVFAWVNSAAAADLQIDDSPGAVDEMAPDPLLHVRFGALPEPRADREILADDLPHLREQVADRLDLDPEVLDSVRYEHDAHDITGGRQQHTYVWIPALKLPLYVDEIDPNGDRFTLRVTHLREGIAPPPAPEN